MAFRLLGLRLMSYPRQYPQRRTCSACGGTWTAHDKNQGRRKTCSSRCAAALARLNSPTYTANCEHCGEPFTRAGGTRIAHYCSRSCAQKAARLRRRAGERDGKRIPEYLEHDPCAYCGGPAGQADHIVPLARGGDDDWTNLTACCWPCNQSKRAKSLLTFVMLRTAHAEFPGWLSAAPGLP